MLRNDSMANDVNFAAPSEKNDQPPVKAALYLITDGILKNLGKS